MIFRTLTPEISHIETHCIICFVSIGFSIVLFFICPETGRSTHRFATDCGCQNQTRFKPGYYIQ